MSLLGTVGVQDNVRIAGLGKNQVLLENATARGRVGVTVVTCKSGMTVSTGSTYFLVRRLPLYRATTSIRFRVHITIIISSVSLLLLQYQVGPKFPHK
jgi:hypothetical protein